MLALDPAFFAVDADAQPEVSEAAFDALSFGFPLDDSHHIQKFGVRIGTDADVERIVQVSVGGFEEVHVDRVGIRRARFGDGCHVDETTPFGECAVVGGVALLAFTPFAVGPVESHGHQGIEIAGPYAKGQDLGRASHGQQLDAAGYHYGGERTSHGDIGAVAERKHGAEGREMAIHEAEDLPRLFGQ